MKRLLLAALLAAFLPSAPAQDLMEDGIFAEAEVRKSDLMQGPLNLHLKASKGKNAAFFTLVFREVMPADITVNTDRESRTFPLRFFRMPHPFMNQAVGQKRDPDGFRFNDLSVYTVGNIYRFLRYDEEKLTEEIRRRILRCASDFPSIRERRFRFDFRTGNDGRTEMYINGNYAGAVPGVFESVLVKGPAGTAVAESGTFRDQSDTLFRTVSFEDGFREGPLMKKAVLSGVKPGLGTFDGVPVRIMNPERSLDVGLHEMLLGQYDVDKNPYTTRQAFDALRGTMMFTVPQRLYTRACVVCAVIPEKGKVPVLTILQKREGLGGYQNSYGEGVSHTTITLPEKEPYPANIRKIGTVKLKGREVPLLLVRTDLNSGMILDIIADDAPKKTGIGPFLEFEFLGGISPVSKMPLKEKSSVHVFGITLEESPLRFEIRQDQAGNIFHNGQKAQFRLAVSGDGAGTLRCEIRDITGKTVSDGTQEFNVSKGKETELVIPLKDEGTDAWYSFVLTAKDKKGRAFFTHEGSYVTLKPDTREAGYESPFGVWLMRGLHNSCGDNAKLRELCFKAGFRRITNPPGDSEEELKPWKITRNQLGHFREGGFDPDHPEEYLSRYGAYIRKNLEKFPHLYSVLIFHEHGGTDTPEEMLGKKVEVDKNSKDQYTMVVRTLAPFIRKNFPNLKIQVGNSCTSGQLIAQLLRNGLDGNLIDCIGIETPGIVAIPEAKTGISSPGSAWATREVTRKFGFDIPVNACFEYTFRQEKYFGSAEQCTRYLLRDHLVGLALGFKTLNAGHLDDANNAYYNSSWGASGLLRRAPYLYPRPAYLAMAVMTRVLDKAKLIRRFETGAASLYALEFRRERKTPDYVYALWTPRPDWAPFLTLRFPAGTALRLVDMFGAETVPDQNASGDIRFRVSHSPVWLLASHPAEKTVSFENPVSADESVKLLDAWKNAENFTLVPPSLMKSPLREPGEFTISAVKDETFGNAVALTLKGNDALPELVGETGAVKFKKPYRIPDGAQEIGFFVKGNSSWGNISLQFADDKGKIYPVSSGANLTLINFEGWHYFRTTLFGKGIHPRPMCKGPLPSPLYFIGFQFIIPRKALNPGEMTDVPREIRFAQLGVLP